MGVIIDDCNACIHKEVCKHKELYPECYEKAAGAGKYAAFEVSVKCKHYKNEDD